ncbi:MAG TPA: hypothetical protein VFM25_13215, partial [Verrucomicrobiae bacterium]|nr:hypothetical protein [Verrucomicrobiae bacterium]
DTEAVDTGIEDLVFTLEKADPSLWTHQQRTVICEWLTYFKSIWPSFKEAVENAANHIGNY